jgi:HSP20 family protein
MTLVKHPSANPYKSIFSDFFLNPVFESSAVRQPAVNIAETEKGFTLEVAAPGLNKADFTIKVEKNLLTISAKKEGKQDENGPVYRRREFAFTQLERSFRLPETIDTDQVNATLANGILYVELLKKPELVPAVKTIAIA